MFTTQPWIFTWMQQLFARKWSNGHGTAVHTDPADSALSALTAGECDVALFHAEVQ